jgi:plasmid stabilization system protein ParE
MRYTVVWSQAALNKLAGIWNESEDRGAVAAASDEIDRLLAVSPRLQGESRGGNVRVLFAGPPGADYEIFEEDRMVQVLIVWRLRQS